MSLQSEEKPPNMMEVICPERYVHMCSLNCVIYGISGLNPVAFRCMMVS